MRRPQIQRAAAQQRRSRRAQPMPFPPPLRGLYARNPNASTSPGMAATLVNWFGDGNSLETRPGMTAADQKWSVGHVVKAAWPFLFGQEERVVAHTADGFRDNQGRHFAASASRATATTVSARVLIAAQGAPVVRYSADGFETADFTSDHESTFTGIAAHHDRVYLWNEGADEAEFFYGPVGAITGPVERFPLGRLGNITGTISMMVPCTVDAGHGANDVLCIFTTSGQVVVYEGIDPGNSLDWRVWGRLQLSPPVHPAAWTQFGADTFVLTRDGVISMMTALKAGASALINSTTKDVRRRIEAEIQAHSALDGWSIITDADGGFTLIQMPQSDGSFRQMVFGHEAQGWFEWDADVTAWVEGTHFTLGYASDGAPVAPVAGQDDRETPITASYASTWFQASPGPRVTLDRVEIGLVSRGALSITAFALADKAATPRAIEEARNVADIRTPHAYGDVEQNHDEMIEIGTYGRSFQLRTEITGKGITWTDMTLWKK